MKKYVKIYMDYHDYVIDDVILCGSCHIKAETDKQFNNQLKQLNKYKHNHKYE